MLQILNLSIYNTDFYVHIPNDENNVSKISQDNPIDSFAELILEEFAGIENAFPENGQSDKSPNLNQNLSFKLIVLDFFPKIEHQEFLNSSQKQKFPSYKEDYDFLFAEDIPHPPNV